MPSSTKSIGSKRCKKKRSNAATYSASLSTSAENKHGDEVYYKVEKIVGCRRRKGGGGYEYKIKWVGYDELTWEPEGNLTESALQEAKALRMKQAEGKLLGSVAIHTTSSDDDVEGMTMQQKDEAELMSLLEDNVVDCQAEQVEAVQENVQCPSPGNTEFDPFDWTDAGQIQYRNVERIDIHQGDPQTVKQRVVDARVNGVPVCLVGHKGWAQFAKEWLDLGKEEANGDGGEVNDIADKGEQIVAVTTTTAVDAQQLDISSAKANEGNHDIVDSEKDEPLLDLSQPHTLNINKMEEHIGNEAVPIRRKRDGFSDDPNKKKVSLRAFLQNCWLHNSNRVNNSTNTSNRVTTTGGAALYLHQWQFPMSDTALQKLCGPGKNIPVPYNILGDDLLCYWHEPERYLGDNPYQYIFMGREGTMSKLHCDKGGLMITIAPIIGQKEVVLVHRSDGPTCLYHLNANLDKPDLNRYPLMYAARVWKTILKPGEILIMPQGTYHQCRNVTPCLSYSRFVLDEVNLRPFVESYFDEDAIEIDHGQVLWNAAYELHVQLDEYSESARKEWKATGSYVSAQDLPNRTLQTLSSLRALRNICREISLREIQKDYAPSDWNDMVHDIDKSLHNFRYRYCMNKPKFVKKRLQAREDATASVANSRKRKLCRDDGSSGVVDESYVSDDDKYDENGSFVNLKRYFRRAPKLSWKEKTTVISDAVKLGIGDCVVVKNHGVKMKGEIVDQLDDLTAAYVQYDGFDEFYDEFIPLHCLRVNVAGESRVGVSLGDIREGKVVYYAEKGEPYRAMVKSVRHGTFYRVSMELGEGTASIERWFSRESFVAKLLDGCRSDQSVPSAVAPGLGCAQVEVASLFDSVKVENLCPPSNLNTEQSMVVTSLPFFVEKLETCTPEEERDRDQSLSRAMQKELPPESIHGSL